MDRRYLRAIDGTQAAGLIPAVWLGATKQYPAAYNAMISRLKTSGPYNETGFLVVQNMSYFETAAAFMNQSVLDDYFVNGSSVVQLPIMQKGFNTNGLMGYHRVPRVPMYI
jgi:hypothetical protein